MKKKIRKIKRFSPEWINAIPRWLARGIWDAIKGEEVYSHAKENARRKRQIDAGRNNPVMGGLSDTSGSNLGATTVVPVDSGEPGRNGAGCSASAESGVRVQPRDSDGSA